MKNCKFKLAPVILAAVLLVACGGGGGGGGSDWATVKTWGTPVFVETIDTQHANFPQVAVDSSGNAIVAWSELYAFGANSARRWVWARRLATGGILGTAVQVDIWGDSAHPKIALTGSGDALAVWEQHDGTPGTSGRAATRRHPAPCGPARWPWKPTA